MTSLRLQTWCGVMLSCLFVAGCVFPATAQQSTVPGSSSVIVPPFVRYSGVLKDVKGTPLTGVVGVTFSLYKDSQSSVPVWTEVQNVYPDSTGRYSVMLGSEKSSGLPTDIFVSGEVRWLGVQVSRASRTAAGAAGERAVRAESRRCGDSGREACFSLPAQSATDGRSASFCPE